MVPDFVTEILVGAAANLASDAVKGGAGWLWQKIKGWSNGNQKNILDTTQKDLLDRGYTKPEDCRTPSEKFLVNFVEGASFEDECELQKMWGHLLANAMDPKVDEKELRVAYMNMLRQMTSADARLLNDFGKTHELDIDKYKRQQGLSDEAFGVSLANLVRLGCVMQVRDKLSYEVGTGFSRRTVALPVPTNKYARTFLGTSFLTACSPR